MGNGAFWRWDAPLLSTPSSGSLLSPDIFMVSVHNASLTHLSLYMHGNDSPVIFMHSHPDTPLPMGLN